MLREIPLEKWHDLSKNPGLVEAYGAVTQGWRAAFPCRYCKPILGIIVLAEAFFTLLVPGYAR